MSLFEQLTEDMKIAMKSGDKERLSTIRLLRGSIRNEAINKREDLSEGEEIAVLSSAAKKRKESIQAYKDGGRADLVQKEERELEIIQAYLPQALSFKEIEKIVDAAIEQTGAKTIHDLGKVMPVVMQQVTGRADGKTINTIVRNRLAV
jgi:uncharacterized protein